MPERLRPVSPTDRTRSQKARMIAKQLSLSRIIFRLSSDLNPDSQTRRTGNVRGFVICNERVSKLTTETNLRHSGWDYGMNSWGNSTDQRHHLRPLHIWLDCQEDPSSCWRMPSERKMVGDNQASKASGANRTAPKSRTLRSVRSMYIEITVMTFTIKPRPMNVKPRGVNAGRFGEFVPLQLGVKCGEYRGLSCSHRCNKENALGVDSQTQGWANSL